MNVREIKNELRKEYLGKRSAIPKEERIRSDGAICRMISETAVFQKAQTILAYAPKEPEVDIFPLIESALALGKRVAFPHCGKDFSLSFYFATLDQLVPGHFGILEPSEDLPICEADKDSLCLVPALLFDEEGFRLGYGKGYYDRFLANYRGQTLGVARNGFILSRLPRGFFDRSVDILISETEVRFLS